ncbi:MAG: hypothetical protein J7M11_01155 [Elusimicrobia bacterium]|nr:hypothetical protein [Elusimicrobiota bacterium]
MDDQEKISLRKQVEILNLQKDVLSRQVSKLRNDLASERTEFQKKQTSLLDDIHAKDIEIRAVRNFMTKRDSEIKNQLKDEFGALEMEKERIAEVSKEIDARRKLIEELISEKQNEFEKQLNAEKELFEKSREEYLKKTKKTQAQLDEYIHKTAVDKKQSAEKINNLREQLIRQNNTIDEKQKEIDSFSVTEAGRAGQIEELKKETAILENEKKALSQELTEKTKVLSEAEKNIRALKEHTGGLNAALENKEKENKKLAGLKTRNDELSKAKSGLEQKLANIQKAQEKEINILQNNIEDKQNAIDSLSNANAEKDGLIAELKKEASFFENEKKALSQELDEKNNRLMAAEKTELSLKKSAEQIKSVMFSREKEISEKHALSKETISKLTAEIEKLKKDNNLVLAGTARKEVAAAQTINKLRKLAGKDKKLLDSFAKRLISIKKEITTLQNNVSEKQNIIDSISAVNAEKDSNIEDLKKETVVFKTENNALRKTNAALEKKLVELESLLQKKDKKIPAKPAPRAVLKFKCSECGAIVSENDKKCPSCGEKFE